MGLENGSKSLSAKDLETLPPFTLTKNALPEEVHQYLLMLLKPKRFGNFLVQRHLAGVTFEEVKNLVSGEDFKVILAEDWRYETSNNWPKKAAFESFTETIGHAFTHVGTELIPLLLTKNKDKEYSSKINVTTTACGYLRMAARLARRLS